MTPVFHATVRFFVWPSLDDTHSAVFIDAAWRFLVFEFFNAHFCFYITDLYCYSLFSARLIVKKKSAENSSDGFVPNVFEIIHLNVNGNLWRDVLVSEPGRPVPVFVPVSVSVGDALWGVGGVWGGVWILTGHLGPLWWHTFIWCWSGLILQRLGAGHGAGVGFHRNQVGHLLVGWSERMWRCGDWNETKEKINRRVNKIKDLYESVGKSVLSK